MSNVVQQLCNKTAKVLIALSIFNSVKVYQKSCVDNQNYLFKQRQRLSRLDDGEVNPEFILFGRDEFCPRKSKYEMEYSSLKRQTHTIRGIARLDSLRSCYPFWLTACMIVSPANPTGLFHVARYTSIGLMVSSLFTDLNFHAFESFCCELDDNMKRERHEYKCKKYIEEYKDKKHLFAGSVGNSPNNKSEICSNKDK